MSAPDVRLAEARRRYGAGDLRGALAQFNEVLAADPGNGEALHGAGLVLLATGDAAQAEPLLARARRQAPLDHVRANDLAVAHRLLGRLDDAAKGFAEAVRADPDYAEGWHNLGLVELARRDAAAARAALERAVAQAPEIALTQLALGVACGQLDDHTAARRALSHATRLAPDEPRGWTNLALSEVALGHAAAGVAAAERARALAPGDPDVVVAHGIALTAAGRYREACAALAAVMDQRAQRKDGWLALSIAAREEGDVARAIEAGRRAHAIAPRAPDVVAHLARALILRKEGTAALQIIDALDDAARAAPEIAFARADALMLTGRGSEALAWYRRTVEAAPCWPGAMSALLFRSLADDAADLPALVTLARHWGRTCLPAPAIRPARRLRDRLRIGYLSPDFVRHSVAFYLRALLPAHDLDVVDVTLYNVSAREDDFTQWFRSRPGIAWRDLADSDADSAARAIAEDGIDVLVDLAGHTRGGRLDIFARRPAPTQVAWLGWAGSTGVPAIGWRLTDAIADPPGCEAESTEIPVRMPHGFHVWRAPDETPPIARNRSSDGPPTFGSFNHAGKISAATIRGWSACLTAVPESRLLLKCESLADASARARLVQAFMDAGISSSRIDIVSMRPPLREHLALYERIDVALDTFPYNGTTTTLEALWMGVPVICRADGDRHAARVGASLLTHAGFTGLLARDEQDFIALACATMAQERTSGGARRESRRLQLAQSPLCDAPHFARRIEAALRDVHARD